MNKLKEWFVSHNISTHGLAALIGTLGILIETNQHVRDILVKDLDFHPRIISGLSAIGAILLAYKQPKKTEENPSKRVP